MEVREEKTIAALATAPGAAGLAVIRVSGPEAGPIAARIFSTVGEPPFYEKASHHAYHGWIQDTAGQAVDEVLLLWMKGPHSFTGENTVEISCHGGSYVSQKILELLYEAGAEPARPGEFTQRAFLNGKMDLTQAEAVMDVIASETALSLRASVSQLRGSLFEKTEELRGRLMEVMTAAEANIDYPEYDVPEVSTPRLQQDCRRIREEAAALLDTAETGRLLRQGIRIAILGAPNVGKSSLLNRLLGQERAIVTDIPGTTRDTVEESADIAGIPVRLIDTAGIHETEDTVEKIGVERARRALSESDLILLVLDAARSIEPEELQLYEAVREQPHLILGNKMDLCGGKNVEWPLSISREIWPVSAKTGEGIPTVQKQIRDLFLKGVVLTDHTPVITNLRQKEALRKAVTALDRVQEAAQAGFEPDLLMIDIREAYDALGEMSGHNVSEDMIQAIFSRFCLGK